MWQDLAKKIGVEVMFQYECESSFKANYSPLFNLITVNGNLPAETIELLVLHEIGHLLKHRNIMGYYTATSFSKMVMEHEAESFVIGVVLPYYLMNTEKEDVSSVQFIERFGLNPVYEPLAKKMILGYFYDKNS